MQVKVGRTATLEVHRSDAIDCNKVTTRISVALVLEAFSYSFSSYGCCVDKAAGINYLDV